MKHILLALTVFFFGCYPSVELPPEDGCGGAGGVSASSASSSSSSGAFSCESPEANIASCEFCIENGCDHPNIQKDQCEFGVAVYEYFAGCTDNPDVKTNCLPMCEAWGVNKVITPECMECAKPYCMCSFNCTLEIKGEP